MDHPGGSRDLYPPYGGDVPWVGQAAVAAGAAAVLGGMLLSAGVTWVVVGIRRRLPREP